MNELNQQPPIVINPGDFLENEYETIAGVRNKIATRLVRADGRIFLIAPGQEIKLS